MKILTVFGTRPEAIKLVTLVNALSERLGAEAKVCITAQHRQMLDQVLDLFAIQPDYDLNVMQNNQELIYLAQAILTGITEVLRSFKPDCVIVQGDTATTLYASLAAFYQKIPVAHVEAGLRSGNLYAPWPEEMNRRLTTHIAALHFAPTELNASHLRHEGIPNDRIFITGNTVIDALMAASAKIEHNHPLLNTFAEQFSFLNENKKLILVTGHRRENFGTAFLNICNALAKLAENPELQIVYPVHFNPNVRKPVYELLSSFQNIYLLDPLDYLPFIYLMQKSYLILTDSGGIQEEAPSLGKPVLVMRNETEREEGVRAGTVKLVGTETDYIVAEVNRLLNNADLYHKISVAHNPYGDGKATERIMQIIIDFFNQK